MLEKDPAIANLKKEILEKEEKFALLANEKNKVMGELKELTAENQDLTSQLQDFKEENEELKEKNTH